MSINKLPGQRVLSSTPTSQMSSSVSSVTSPRACCENGRPIMTDPHTGQTVCSCQYGTALLNYSRVQGLPEGIYGASAAAYAVGATQGYVPLGAEGSAFYSPLGNPAFDIKEGSEAWRALAAQSGGCFPYDPSMALYPYGSGYGGLDLNARRKNATRETTNTLKAWLYEHRKNPYPTKGEKIMLAIITKMTLTQVSTWFANARRRLKKENKMTWSPRNRSEDDASGDEDVDVKANDSDSGNLNSSVDDSHDTNQSNKDVLDRIISVDDDDEDSDNAELADLDSHSETSITETSKTISQLNNNGPVDQQFLVNGAASDTGTSSEGDKSSKLNTDSERSNNSGSESQNSRPKIWSVTDFLIHKDSESSDNSSSSTTTTPAIVCSRQPSSAQLLNFHQTNQSMRNGHFPVGFRGYPLSLSHSTLSYPYSLSTSTDTKSDINFKHAHAAALRAEQAFKEGLVQRSAKLQNGLFSPARELDGLRVSGKIVL